MVGDTTDMLWTLDILKMLSSNALRAVSVFHSPPSSHRLNETRPCGRFDLWALCLTRDLKSYGLCAKSMRGCHQGKACLKILNHELLAILDIYLKTKWIEIKFIYMEKCIIFCFWAMYSQKWCLGCYNRQNPINISDCDFLIRARP